MLALSPSSKVVFAHYMHSGLLPPTPLPPIENEVIQIEVRSFLFVFFCICYQTTVQYCTDPGDKSIGTATSMRAEVPRPRPFGTGSHRDTPASCEQMDSIRWGGHVRRSGQSESPICTTRTNPK